LKPCLSSAESPSFLSYVKNVCLSNSAGTVSLSPAITLSRSNKKNGALGKFYFERDGLFRSLISSRLKIASNLEYGASLSPRNLSFCAITFFESCVVYDLNF
jgi:hypothetical protein